MKLWIIAALAIIAAIVYEAQSNAAAAASDPNAVDQSSTDQSGSGLGMTFAQAWVAITTKFENVGASTNSAAAQGSNNPGGLNIGPNNPLYTSLPGVIGTIPSPQADGQMGVITLFDSLANGLNALQVVIDSYVTNHPNLSIIQAVSRYITGSAGSGDPNTYAAGIQSRAGDIAAALGGSVTDTIGSFGTGG